MIYYWQEFYLFFNPIPLLLLLTQSENHATIKRKKTQNDNDTHKRGIRLFVHMFIIP